jgi:hypothetical protein
MCGTQSRFFFFLLLLLLLIFSLFFRVGSISRSHFLYIFSLVLPSSSSSSSFHFPILLSTYRVLIAKSRTDGAHASDAPGESPPHKGIRRTDPVNKKIGKK